MDRYQSCERLIQKFACLSKVADVVDLLQSSNEGNGFLEKISNIVGCE